MQRPIIGLAEIPKGIEFRCGDCQYYANGKCYHEEPELHLRPVGADWCCDWFRHPGMRIILK